MYYYSSQGFTANAMTTTYTSFYSEGWSSSNLLSPQIKPLSEVLIG